MKLSLKRVKMKKMEKNPKFLKGKGQTQIQKSFKLGKQFKSFMKEQRRKNQKNKKKSRKNHRKIVIMKK